MDIMELIAAERNAIELFKRYWPTDTARYADFRLFMYALVGQMYYGHNIQYLTKKYGMQPTGQTVKRNGKIYRTFKVR